MINKDNINPLTEKSHKETQEYANKRNKYIKTIFESKKLQDKYQIHSITDLQKHLDNHGFSDAISTQTLYSVKDKYDYTISNGYFVKKPKEIKTRQNLIDVVDNHVKTIYTTPSIFILHIDNGYAGLIKAKLKNYYKEEIAAIIVVDDNTAIVYAESKDVKRAIINDIKNWNEKITIISSNTTKDHSAITQ